MMNNVTKLKSVCVLASFPPRKASMLKVVETISPQCDTLCIWLNEYNSIPEELNNFTNLDIRLGGNDNIKDAGKFAFLDKYRDCYYLTIDDDINYAKNYVKMLTRNIDRYGRKCIVSYHGHVFPCGRKHIYIPFYGNLSRDVAVNNRVGTGVAGFVPSGINIPIISMKRLHEIDTDVSFGIWAINNGVPMIVCGHKTGWLTNITIDNIKYNNIQRLTGSKELAIKRKNEYQYKLKTRTILHPELEAEILSRNMSII